MKNVLTVLAISALVAGCRGGKGGSGGRGSGLLTQRQAEDVVRDLPEVTAWADAVRRKTGARAVPVCRAERTPNDPVEGGGRVWVLYFGESRKTHTQLWNRFQVDAVSGEVWVWDPFHGNYIPLAEWREKSAFRKTISAEGK